MARRFDEVFEVATVMLEVLKAVADGVKPVAESESTAEEKANVAEEVVAVAMNLLTVVSAAAVIWLAFVVTGERGVDNEDIEADLIVVDVLEVKGISAATKDAFTLEESTSVVLMDFLTS